ncbi:MAG: hypothetical protein U9Q98_03585, partial [Bacteroidota bacterium]|nr:hypothetical protein [Bacteroidota bacterium]
LALFLSGMSVFSANAQADRSLWKEAEGSLMVHDYRNARINYNMLLDKDEDNANYAFKIGYCYLHDETPFLLEQENLLYFGSEKHNLPNINKRLQPLVDEMTCSPDHAFRTEYMDCFDIFVSVYDSWRNKWRRLLNSISLHH